MEQLFLNRRMEQFMAVYEQGTIHGAAEELGISQPALTVSLRNLEEAIGAKLFSRSVRGMSPTPAGDTLYRFGGMLRQGARFALGEIRRHEQGTIGSMRVGAGVAWATTILPGILNELHQTYPDLAIDLITGVGDQLAARMISGELDMILAAGSILSLSSEEFVCTPLTNLPMKVVVDPGSKLTHGRPVTPRELSSVPWVGFYEDENIVQFSNHFLASHGLPPAKFAMRTNSPTALTAFMKGTDFAAVLIAPLARSAASVGLVQLEASVPLWNLPVNIYHRSVVNSAVTIQKFVELARSVMTKFQ